MYYSMSTQTSTTRTRGARQRKTRKRVLIFCYAGDFEGITMAAMKSQSEKYTAPQKYLTSETRDRVLDLIKERKITQSDLAKKAGLQESTLSRFLQGRIKKLGDGSLIKLARALNVSTDFLLGETDIPDRLNYDIDELGLSAEAAKLLFTRRVDPEMLNQLIENPRFPKLLLLLKSYQDNSLQAGYQSMNNIMGTWSSLLLGQAKNYPEDAQAATEAAKFVDNHRFPPVATEKNRIQNLFMLIVQDLKQGFAPQPKKQDPVTTKFMEKLRQRYSKGEETLDLRKIRKEGIVDSIIEIIAETGIPPKLLSELQSILLRLFTSYEGNRNDK